MPVAAAMLALVYAQSLGAIIPLGRNDPFARLLGMGFPVMADQLAAVAGQTKAGAILTSDYETTAWLRFYRPDLKNVELGESYRYPPAGAPPPALLAQPFVYVAQTRRDRHAQIATQFRRVEPMMTLALNHRGMEFSTYSLYRVSGPMRAIDAKMP